MKFVLTTNEFVPQLQQLSKVVASKTTLPILDCVKLDMKKDKNYLIATTFDTDTLMQMVCGCEMDEDISICVDVKLLLSTLSNLMDKVIEFNVDKDSHTIIGKYKNGKLKLPYFDTDDYPTIPIIDGTGEGEHTIMIKGEKLGNAIAMTKGFVANDALRPQMNGVHIDFDDNQMVSVATDGHRLVKYVDSNIQKEDKEKDGTTWSLTIPEKPINVIHTMVSKYDGDVKMLFSDNQVVVKCTEFNIVARLAEGRYPNYNAVIPKDNNNVVKVKKLEMVEAIKHVTPLGNQKEEILSLAINGNEIKVKMEDIEFSTGAEETIACEHNGDDITIGFKSSFLMQMVQNIGSDDVVIRLIDSQRAGTFVWDGEIEQGIEYVSILMPLVLNQK